MWLVFAITTTLLWGLAELFYKKGSRPEEAYAHLKVCICVGLVMGLHALFTLLTGHIGYDPRNLVRYLPVSLLYIGSMAFSFFGMRFIAESVSDPIENTSGAICSLLCVVFLKDTLSLPAAAAILVILAGVLGVGFLENRGETLRKRTLGKAKAALAFAMPFLYALLDALGSFLDVFYLEEVSRSPLLGVTEDTIEQVANTSYELTFAACGLLLYGFLRLKVVKMDWGQQGDKLLAAGFETAGQLTYVYAMSGNGVVSAPILSSVCVVSLLLSRVFLREKLSRKQYFYIGLVIFGILALAVLDEL